MFTKLNDLCPELTDDSEILESLMTHLAEPYFLIANAGPMNPGKSTLFNALLGKKEVFQTSDARQTVENQEEAYNNTVHLLDTPGCNSANLEDDEIAGSAFRRSDLVLFVHNISTGGIQAAELRLLKYLQKIFTDDFQKRVLFICNRTDEAENKSILNQNIDEIQAQINTVFGFEMEIFKVSPINYFYGLEDKENGNTESAKVLIQESGIPNLKRVIHQKVQTLKRRGTAEIQDILQKIESNKESIQKNIEQSSNHLNRQKQSVRKAWMQTLSNIQPSWQECL